MYEYFIGQITAVTPFYLVLEVNGIGYQIFVANPFRYQEDTEKPVKVFVYQAIRENDMTLFGFYDLNEKKLFEKLLNVSGIGPKSALAILANDDHRGLVNAINTEDVSYLIKFPGVGKKTAQQIVLDLKGKLDDIEGQAATMPGQQSLDFIPSQASPFMKESLEALSALGYSQREIKAISKNLTSFEADSTDAYLREGLKLLMKK